MKIFTIIFVLLTFLSCSITKELTTEQIVGKYKWSGFYGVGSSIELKADRTFEYNWVTGLISGTTKGTWTSNGTKIILNSKRQPATEKDNDDFYVFFTDKILVYKKGRLYDSSIKKNKFVKRNYYE